MVGEVITCRDQYYNKVSDRELYKVDMWEPRTGTPVRYEHYVKIFLSSDTGYRYTDATYIYSQIYNIPGGW